MNKILRWLAEDPMNQFIFGGIIGGIILLIIGLTKL
jgi:hypothetical protein